MILSTTNKGGKIGEVLLWLMLLITLCLVFGIGVYETRFGKKPVKETMYVIEKRVEHNICYDEDCYIIIYKYSSDSERTFRLNAVKDFYDCVEVNDSLVITKL